MFGILKKLFTSKKETAPVISNNQELIEKLYNLIYDDNLVLRINKPESKILLLNVYYLTFGDLLLNIVSKTSERQIASVNFFSYFRDVDDLKYTLKRIIPILESTTVNVKIVHDLNEIIDSLDFLKSIEE